MNLGDLAPQVGFDFLTLLEVDGSAQAVHGRLVFVENLEGGAQGRQYFGAANTVGAGIPEPAQRVFVVVDRLAVQVQNARTTASGAEIVHGSVAFGATPKQRRDEGVARGYRVTGHLLEGVSSCGPHWGGRCTDQR